jgi:hypothetical protein
VREPKWQIKEIDLGWVIYKKRDQMWVSVGWGPFSAREDAEKALRDYINNQLKHEERERARRIDASFYDDLGVKMQRGAAFSGAGAMGTVVQEWR